MEEFPPYELNVDRGEELFNKPLKMVILTGHVLRMLVLVSDKIILILILKKIK